MGGYPRKGLPEGRTEGGERARANLCGQLVVTSIRGVQSSSRASPLARSRPRRTETAPPRRHACTEGGSALSLRATGLQPMIVDRRRCPRAPGWFGATSDSYGHRGSYAALLAVVMIGLLGSFITRAPTANDVSVTIASTTACAMRGDDSQSSFHTRCTKHLSFPCSETPSTTDGQSSIRCFHIRRLSSEIERRACALLDHLSPCVRPKTVLRARPFDWSRLQHH